MLTCGISLRYFYLLMTCYGIARHSCSTGFMSPIEATRKRNLTALTRELGATVVAELENPKTFEIMLNPDGRLWVKRVGESMRPVGEMSSIAAISMLNTVASMLDVSITAENPILEAELPLDGSRLQGLIPPVVTRPTFTIRKKAVAIFTLTDYVESGILSEGHCVVIRRAVRDRRNILIVGGTGSGKTTLCNAIVHEIVEANPDHRIVLIEDTAEIQCSAENAVILHTSKTVDLRQLLRATLRLFPTRILVGEVRDGAALDLLKAWNTGHPGGLATIHADSAAGGLVRMEQLISEVSAHQMPHVVADAINLVVFITQVPASESPAERKVTQVMEVTGYENNRYILKSL